MNATKTELRAKMRERRRALFNEDRAQAASLIAAKLLHRGDVQSVIARHKAIAVYLAVKDELDLSNFIAAASAKDALLVAPRWNGVDYSLAMLGGELVEGPHGILEPTASARVIAPTEIALWLLPGLAFDSRGNRLGYGGGWYDRMLAKRSVDSTAIGVAYAFQIVDEVPTMPHDIKLDDIISI